MRADLDSYHSRRLKIRGEHVRETLSRVFGPEGELSAAEIAFLVQSTEKGERAQWIVAIVREAIRSYEAARTRQGLDSLELPRILHTLGSVLLKISSSADKGKSGGARDIAAALRAGLTAAEKKSLSELGLPVEGSTKLKAWAGEMRETAFRQLSRTIVFRSGGVPRASKECPAQRRDRLGPGTGQARPGRRLDRHSPLFPRARRVRHQRGRGPQRPGSHSGLRPGYRKARDPHQLHRPQHAGGRQDPGGAPGLPQAGKPVCPGQGGAGACRIRTGGGRRGRPGRGRSTGCSAISGAGSS